MQTLNLHRAAKLIKLYFGKPRKFVSQYLTKNTPHVAFVAWLVGIGGVIKKFPTDVLVLSPSGWGSLWLQFFFWGALGGAVTYYIAGTINYLVQKWAKGTADSHVSRNMTVYALLPVNLLLIIVLVINMSAFGDTYIVNRYSMVDRLFFPIAIIALAWSAYFLYSGFRSFDMNKRVALVWFIVLPAIFYSASFLIGLLLLSNPG